MLREHNFPNIVRMWGPKPLSGHKSPPIRRGKFNKQSSEWVCETEGAFLTTTPHILTNELPRDLRVRRTADMSGPTCWSQL